MRDAASLPVRSPGPHSHRWADWAVSRLVQLPGAGAECEGAEACRATQQLMQFAGVREAVSRHLRLAGLSPFLSLTHCEQLFPHCFYM